MHYHYMTTAIEEAMEDIMDNGSPTPADPVIARDAGGYYYGSRLTADECGDQVIYNVTGGFGSWTPETADDVQECAIGLASECGDSEI